MSRVEIEVEANRLLREAGRQNDPYAKATITAFLEHDAGVPIDQNCPACGNPIAVKVVGAAWVVSCPCGKSKDTLRGI